MTTNINFTKLSVPESDFKKKTRPQTAILSSSTNTQIASGITIQIEDNIINPRSIYQGQIPKYQSPSSLSPRSLQKLREPPQIIEEKVPYPYSLLRNPPQKRTEHIASSFSHNLHVRQDVAEIEAPENHFIKEIKINKDEYERFKQNFHKIVFDSFGNYIYTKPESQTPGQKELLDGAMTTVKSTSQNLKRKLLTKTQDFKPKRIIEGLVKSSSEIAQMNPRRKAIMEAKQKTQNTLNLMINNMAKEKILYESKATLAQTTQSMMNEVDNFIRDNSILKQELEKLQTQQMELHSVNESLNFKNQILQRELKETKDKLESVKRGSTDLERFIPHYKLLIQKFPDFSADKLIDKYEYLENTCLDMTKKLGDFEEENRTLEKSIIQQRKDFNEQLQLLINQKQQKSIDDQRNDNRAIKDDDHYKDEYTLLFQKIMQIYCDWTTKSKAYLPDKVDKGPRVKLNDPIEMLQNMERMISISTNDKLQSYLRKIIVSANLLQRKYLPDNVNDKFDPDKIYERITKLLDTLNTQNSKLQQENKLLIKRCGGKQVL